MFSSKPIFMQHLIQISNPFWSRVLLVMSITLLVGIPGYAQEESARPDNIVKKEPKTYIGEGINNALGLGIFINNFGFGVGGEYRRFIEPYSDITISVDITGIRDVSEQTFTDPFFGQQIIPNKYKRVLAFPIRVGYRHRFFAQRVTDGFRIHLAAQAGPALTFTYPYFYDKNNSGFRESDSRIFSGYYEPVNDFFKGWKEGDLELGLSGKMMVSFDFGSTFERLTSVEFGFNFFYYPQGIQIMEPKKANITRIDPPEIEYEIVDFYDKQKYFGTPQITFVFGKLW
jgi:hypothetical protein